MADAKAQKRQKFDAVYPILRDELLAYMKQEGMPEDAISWYKRVRISIALRIFTLPQDIARTRMMLTATGRTESGLQRPRGQAQSRHVRRRFR